MTNKNNDKKDSDNKDSALITKVVSTRLMAKGPMGLLCPISLLATPSYRQVDFAH